MTRGTLVIPVASLEHLPSVEVLLPSLAAGMQSCDLLHQSGPWRVSLAFGTGFLTPTPRGLPEPRFSWGFVPYLHRSHQ